MDTNTASLKPASSKSIPGYRSLGVALTLGLGVWLGGTVMGIAQADTPPVTTESATVVYSDLDISTEHGARALLQRIDLAAKTACGEKTHSPLLPREGATVRACVADAVESTVVNFKSPALASVHDTYKQAGVTLAAR